MTNQLDNYSQLRSLIISHLNEYRHQLVLMNERRLIIEDERTRASQDGSIITLGGIIQDLEDILNEEYFNEPLRIEYENNCKVGEYI